MGRHLVVTMALLTALGCHRVSAVSPHAVAPTPTNARWQFGQFPRYGFVYGQNSPALGVSPIAALGYSSAMLPSGGGSAVTPAASTPSAVDHYRANAPALPASYMRPLSPTGDLHERNAAAMDRAASRAAPYSVPVGGNTVPPFAPPPPPPTTANHAMPTFSTPSYPNGAPRVQQFAANGAPLQVPRAGDVNRYSSAASPQSPPATLHIQTPQQFQALQQQRVGGGGPVSASSPMTSSNTMFSNSVPSNSMAGSNTQASGGYALAPTMRAAVAPSSAGFQPPPSQMPSQQQNTMVARGYGQTPSNQFGVAARRPPFNSFVSSSSAVGFGSAAAKTKVAAPAAASPAATGFRLSEVQRQNYYHPQHPMERVNGDKPKTAATTTTAPTRVYQKLATSNHAHNFGSAMHSLHTYRWVQTRGLA